jgi:hypothetical protein
LIYYKPEQKENLRVLKITKPNDSSVVRTQIDDILYQKMHTRDEVFSAKFLGIFNTKVTNKHLLEVILIRDYSLEAQSFITDNSLYKKVMDLSRPLTKNGYHVEFVWKVNVNKITSRLFKEGSSQVGFNYQLEAGGTVYNKTEDFTKKILTTLQTMDINLFIAEEAKLKDVVKSDDAARMEDVLKSGKDTKMKTASKSENKTAKTIKVDYPFKNVLLQMKEPKDYAVAETIIFDKKID